MTFARSIRSALPVALGMACLAGATTAPAFADTEAPPDATIGSPKLQDEVFGIKPLTFTGTATDDVGVAEVGVAIQERTSPDRLWYRPDGTWGAYHRFGAVLGAPGEKQTAWKFTWTPPIAGEYTLQVVAKDKAGNPDAVLPFRRFSVDSTAPNATVKTPSSSTISTRKGRTLAFTGTATDDHGVRYLRVAIQNRSTGKYLRSNGTWGSIHWFDKPVAQPGARSTTWRYSRTWTSTGQYRVYFGALDRAGLSDPTAGSKLIKVSR